MRNVFKNRYPWRTFSRERGSLGDKDTSQGDFRCRLGEPHFGSHKLFGITSPSRMSGLEIPPGFGLKTPRRDEGPKIISSRVDNYGQHSANEGKPLEN